MIENFRNKFVRIKVYLHRALSYAALINMGLILFLALSNLEKYKIDIKLETWALPIFIGLTLILVLFGYLEDKFGFYTEEQRMHSTRNPQMTEILKRLKTIEKRL